MKVFLIGLSLAAASVAQPRKWMEERARATYEVDLASLNGLRWFRVRLPERSSLQGWTVFRGQSAVGVGSLAEDDRHLRVLLQADRLNQLQREKGPLVLLGFENRGGPGAPRVTDEPGGALEVSRSSGAGWDRLFQFVTRPRLLPGLAPKSIREAYVYPAWIRDVNVLDDFPEDHVHHRGISWSWPVVEVAGKTTDLWTLDGCAPKFEEVIHRRKLGLRTQLLVRNGWYVGGKPVMDERVRMTTWARAVFQKATVVDFELTWKAIDAPVRIAGQPKGGKGYGGFGARLAPRRDAAITGPEGPVTEDTLHTTYPWVDYSARFRGSDRVTGVTVMAHPGNLGHPSEWLVRHYGYIGESWPGVDGFTFKPGEPVTRRYRVVFHDFGVNVNNPARLARIWADYADPGTVTAVVR